MKKTDLFRMMQLTRAQVLYGYILSGIQKNDLSNLAEHHYLVTFIAWRLALSISGEGGKINVQRVMELAMIHDLAELFGGDISLPLARINPEARKHAKQFQQENNKLITEFFGDKKRYYQDLCKELEEKKTDESIIVKLADYIEMGQYKEYVKSNLGDYPEKIVKGSNSLFAGLKDPTAKKTLKKFLVEWSKEIGGKTFEDVLLSMTEAKNYKSV
jgi:5'-deoxynucleotidase YfbR-like HD superfamily hydrolase